MEFDSPHPDQNMRGPERKDKNPSPYRLIPEHLKDRILYGNQKQVETAYKELFQWSRVTGIGISHQTLEDLDEGRWLEQRLVGNAKKEIMRSMRPSFTRRLASGVRGIRRG